MAGSAFLFIVTAQTVTLAGARLMGRFPLLAVGHGQCVTPITICITFMTLPAALQVLHRSRAMFPGPFYIVVRWFDGFVAFYTEILLMTQITGHVFL